MTRPIPRRLGKQVGTVVKANPPPDETPQSLPDTTKPPAVLADDLLVGANAIAEFMFGTAKERRRVYWLVETGQLPVFKYRTTICARKSTILRDVELRERAVTVGAELSAAKT
jgi:hypothetical protein